MQKILVIKQTSLGDVLHASGHLRVIKQNFPDAELHLLTAVASAELVKYHASLDKVILLDRDALRNWRRPARAFNELRRVLREVRRHSYDLAFDLQGLLKSAIFLYAARAPRKQKFIKGRWLGLRGFRDRARHAIDEMDEVLRVAGLRVDDSEMTLPTSAAERARVDELLREVNPKQLPFMIFSPFSRWRSKDWPLKNYTALAHELARTHAVIFTAPELQRDEVDAAVKRIANPRVASLAGRLSLLELAELLSRAELVVCGDSFPMHAACAKGAPVAALFAPTDARKVGPRGAGHRVLRARGCDMCEKPRCPKRCLDALSVDTLREWLGA